MNPKCKICNIEMKVRKRMGGSAWYCDNYYKCGQWEEFTEKNKIANKTPLNKGVASGTLCQQDERARTVVGDMASSEVSLDASKSDSNKRDGSPADTTQSDTKPSEVQK